MIYLWIALGSALGGIARYWFSGIITASLGETFPWGTILVNILGCFAIGFFVALTEPNGQLAVNTQTKHFFITGLCGGFTTFSAFSFQTLQLAHHRESLLSGANIIFSVGLCLASVWIGFALATALSQLKGI
jgi:CrcB protein